MDQQNSTLAKIPILDTGKFEQWQFRIQQYLQHEHYALWEVIEFGDFDEVPVNAETTDTASDGTGKKKGKTVTVTADDMQKRKNDVKAITTLLLSLPDEHQLRFTKGSETLEQMFNRLQVIVSQLQFMDVEIEQDDLNQKGNEEVNTASVSTASTNVPTASANIGIDEDDMEEMDTKWNMTLLSMRDDRAPKSQDRRRRDNFRQGSKVEEQAPKALMEIDEMGWDWSYMENDEENHALVADKEALTEFALIAKTSAESKTLKKENEGLDGKLAGFQSASKDLDGLFGSQRLDKNKEGLGYSAVSPPPAQIYSYPKKDMSWTGLPEFKEDTVTDYSRPSPTIDSSPDDAQNRNPLVTETEASPSTISPKPFIKFVKANNNPTKSKTDKVEIAKKHHVKYAKQYRKPTKKPNVRGNQRNWNNSKSHQLGPNFVMEKKACFNCGDFNHLAYDCRKMVRKGITRSQNNTHKSFTPRPTVYKPYRPPIRQMRSNMNVARPNITSFNKPTHSYTKRPFQRTSAVRSQYRAPWVPSINKNFPPVNRKFSTVSRNFSTVNRKFPIANRKISTGGTKFSTADMGKKGKAVNPQLVGFGSLHKTYLTRVQIATVYQ
uniref:Ubiquitin hydrolase n=1 Tax=Tanacetum cinerariifolium TaxID=118510 RepID=A0A699I6K9_TANCI|nr:ubiquitin hydrolase [Tanacetum cinerariifolium]